MILAVDLPYWAQSLLRVLGGTVAVLLPAGTIVYLFLFKMMSFMQSRLGPMEAGPYGSLQLFAEVGKWLQKEDISPEHADKRIFRMRAAGGAGQHLPAGRSGAVRPRRLLHRLRGRRVLHARGQLHQHARHPHGRLELGQQVLTARRPACRRSAHRLRAADGARRARRGHPGRHDEPADDRASSRTPTRSSAGTGSATRTSSPSSSASSCS